MNSLRLTLIAVLLFASAAAARAQGDIGDAVLEKYTLGMGQNSDGLVTALNDKFFGGGDARASIAFLDTKGRYNPSDTSGTAVLFVSRYVPPDMISFALLCDRVEVRGFDAEGAEVYSKDLPGFVFGDSKSGRYAQTLRQIPLSVASLQITFFGNYE